MIESNGTTASDNQDQENADVVSRTAESQESSLEKLNARIQELESQLKDKDAKYLYLYADFDNFKKRSIKERSDLIKFGWESVARELLQTMDNLERALDHTPANSDKSWVEGLKMVLNHLKSTLQKQGVQHIECFQKLFDPNFHEAVGQENSGLAAGTITKEHTRGYMLHGRLLRPARVSVSSGTPANTDAETTQPS